MSVSVPPRRSTRISVVQKKEDTKFSSSQPTTGAKLKAKAPLVKKRGRAASQNVYVPNENVELSCKKPRTRGKAGSLAPVASSKGQGKLSLFIEAPVDVLFEIFSHLEPLDLLRMSRTTKPLRCLLMDRSSISVWQSALKKVIGLPPPLEGFSEPQYVNLIFDDHCHNCHEASTKDITWQVRTRLCNECLDNGTIMATEERLRQLHLVGDNAKARDLRPITPSFSYPRGVYRHLLKYLAPAHVMWPCWGETLYYELSTWKRLVEEGAPLRRGSPEYATWLLEKQKEHEALVASYKAHEKWFNNRTELRLSIIIARLKADGWEELDQPRIQEIIEGHPLVDTFEPLSEPTWDAIHPILTEVMSQARADILKAKVESAIEKRTQALEVLVEEVLKKLPETPHNPPASAFCTYQPFLDIIKTTPPEEDVTDKLKEALQTVPDLCEKWRQEQSAQLKAMLRKKKGRSDDLTLVVNAFTCVDCSKRPTVLHYPHFATHACFFSTTSVGDTKVGVWSGKAIRVLNEVIYNRCVGFVRDCGLDPKTATAKDMDTADVFFRCQECESEIKDGIKSVRLMRWRTAMNHHHPAGVARVDDDELIALGRSKEKDMFDNELSWPAAHKAYRWTFVCVHCGVEESSPAARVEHLHSVHGIDGSPKKAEHYRRGLKYTNLNHLSVLVAVE